MPKSATKLSVNLDAMRALAAFTVFGLHSKGLFIRSVVTIASVGHTEIRPLRNADQFTTLPHEAVIAFFILSGCFVGGGVLRAWRSNEWNWATFAIQRLTRLWIVLIPALFVTIILDTIGLTRFGLNGIYGHPAWQVAASSQVLDNLNFRTFVGCTFFLQKILVQSLGTNSPLWTLSYEFWFYVAFPVVVSVLSSRLSWRWRLVNVVLLAGVAVFVGQSIMAYFLIWLMGATLQLVPAKLSPKRVSVLLPMSVTMVLVVSLALVVLRWPLYISDLIEGAACTFLCYVILHGKAAAGGGLYTKLAPRLSDMSYTLYLTHYPILTFICAALASRGLVPGHGLTHWLIFVGATSAAFFVCYGLYWCFERHTLKVRQMQAYFLPKPERQMAAM